jgi:hypothetical protein
MMVNEQQFGNGVNISDRVTGEFSMIIEKNLALGLVMRNGNRSIVLAKSEFGNGGEVASPDSDDNGVKDQLKC